MFLAVFQRYLSSSEKTGLINSSLEGNSNPDLCYEKRVLCQLSYQLIT
mgnify:CR=1 FL=1